MLGDVTNFGRYVSTSTNAKEFQKRTFFYGQDTWRATHKPDPQPRPALGDLLPRDSQWRRATAHC